MFYGPVVVVQSAIYRVNLEQCCDLISTTYLFYLILCHTKPYVNGPLFILGSNKDPNFRVDLFKFLAGWLIL
jgi:hypothetical protein